MRSLPGSLADGVLADTISAHLSRKVRDNQKGTETKDASQCLMLHPYITTSRTSS